MIDFFLEKRVLAQANAKVNGSIEPVIVFKSFNFSGDIVGASLQGIEENWEMADDELDQFSTNSDAGPSGGGITILQ